MLTRLFDFLFGTPCEAARSPRWFAVRAAHLRQFPTCAACGGKSDLEVHHVVPFQLDPSLELVPANLLTLCEPHHLLFGHLMNWQSWNVNAPKDAAEWREKIKQRP